MPWTYEPPRVPIACISPTSTATDEDRVIAGNVPPPVAFDDQEISMVTVASRMNLPSGCPADEYR